MSLNKIMSVKNNTATVFRQPSACEKQEIKCFRQETDCEKQVGFCL